MIAGNSFPEGKGALRPAVGLSGSQGQANVALFICEQTLEGS